MISEAYISGQIHSAVYRENGELFVLETGDENKHRNVTLRAIDLNGFLIANPETELYKDINWSFEKLQSVLYHHIAKHEALELCLTGMDTTYSNEIRKEAIDILTEDYYSDKKIKDFVINRVFGTSIPTVFDPISAARIAQGIGNKELYKLYNDLSYAGDLIVTVRDAWKRTIAKNEQSLKSFSSLDKSFTDEGIIAGFVLAKLKQDNNAFDGIVIKFADKVKQLEIRQAPLFLTEIKELIELKHPRSQQKKAIFSDTDIEDAVKDSFAIKFHELIVRFEGKTKRKRQSIKGTRSYANNNAFADIAGQIDRVKERIVLGDFKEAEECILQLIELQNVNSDPQHICKSLCDIAQCYQEHGNIVQADLLAIGAANIYDQDAVPFCILAENYRKGGKFEDALLAYNETIKQFGNNAVAKNGKAETLRELGRLPEALDIYNETIKQFGNNVVAFCGKAETLRELGRLPEALDIYNETIKQFGNNVVAFCGKAETLRELGRLPEALDIYNETIKQFGNDAVAKNGKAETLRELGRLPEALDIYNETIKQFGNNAVAKNGKAETLRELGRLPEALDIYNETIKQFGNNVVAFCGKAETLRELGRLPEALDIYNETIKQFGNNVVAFCGKAETLRELGRLPEALDIYNETIKQFGNDAVAKNGKAETLRELGRLQEALDIYNETIKQFGNNAVAKTARFMLLIQLNQDIDSVIAQINIPNPQTNDEWINYHLYCMLLLKQNNIDEAINKLRKGVRESFFAQQPYFRSALSLALIKKKEYREARQVLNESNVSLPLKSVLIVHTFAAENNLNEARKQISIVIKSPFQKIRETSEYLSERYTINPGKPLHQGMNKHQLDARIEALEFELLSDIYFKQAA